MAPAMGFVARPAEIGVRAMTHGPCAVALMSVGSASQPLEELVEIRKEATLLGIPIPLAIGLGKDASVGASEGLLDLLRGDGEVEVTISPAAMAAIHEADDGIQVDNHIAQRRIAMSDNEVLAWRFGTKPIEQGLRGDATVALVKTIRVDFASFDQPFRSRETRSQGLVEGALGERKCMEPGKATSDCSGKNRRHKVGMCCDDTWNRLAENSHPFGGFMDCHDCRNAHMVGRKPARAHDLAAQLRFCRTFGDLEISRLLEIALNSPNAGLAHPRVDRH